MFCLPTPNQPPLELQILISQGMDRIILLFVDQQALVNIKFPRSPQSPPTQHAPFAGQHSSCWIEAVNHYHFMIVSILIRRVLSPPIKCGISGGVI